MMMPAHRLAGLAALSLLGLLGAGPLLAQAQGHAKAPGQPLDTAARSQAASRVATASPACRQIRPFYWEVGDGAGPLASGSVDQPGRKEHIVATTRMGIASASKWLYGAYVVQRRAGALTAEDIQYLTFRSGYTQFSLCLRRQTVQGCVNFARNGVYDPQTDGLFDYDGGHMQNHAARVMGLGPLGNKALAQEIQSQLGSDIGLSYNQPQLAGGAETTAADYALFLRKLINRELLLGDHLGEHAVCANPLTCPRQAVDTPVPLDETWHYSLGHWVEDDPVEGDGSFSSAGAFGFYPWIDAGRTQYGVIARQAEAGSGDASMECGREIRKAWNGGARR